MTPDDTTREVFESVFVKHGTLVGQMIGAAVHILKEDGYVVLPAAEVEAIRDKALEESAQLMQRGGIHTLNERAAAIRSLKGAKP